LSENLIKERFINYLPRQSFPPSAAYQQINEREAKPAAFKLVLKTPIYGTLKSAIILSHKGPFLRQIRKDEEIA
jgi:hypothetical protein